MARRFRVRPRRKYQTAAIASVMAAPALERIVKKLKKFATIVRTSRPLAIAPETDCTS